MSDRNRRSRTVANPFQSLRSVLTSDGYSSHRHVLHIGAHQGQEVSFYRDSRINRITLVEPVPELAQYLRREYIDVEVLQWAVGTQRGVLPFYVMEPSNVSTLQEPGPHDRVKRVIEVDVVTLQDILDHLEATPPDILVVDAQGRELDVLQSGFLGGFSHIIVETCTVDDPNMASGYEEVVDYMASVGYKEKEFWPREYMMVNAFARGQGKGPSPYASGEIRDVVFVKEIADV